MDEKQAMIASLINNLIRDEWEAIEGYNGVIATLADSEGDDIDGIISNLEDIRDEEYVHVGQLESCLSVLKGDPVEQINDGSEEGFEKLELPEEEEDDAEIEETESLKEAHSYGWGRVSDSWDEYDDGNHTFTLYINDRRVDSDYDIQSLISRAEDSDGFAEIWVDGEDLDHAVWTNESLQKPNGKTLKEEKPELKTEYLKESDGESFDWDITDEVDREYERITKKFPNITDDELEDRLYSSIANILSGWQMEDKGKTIDNIINAVMNEKRRAISTEDVSTEEMKNVICSMINEYDASEEEVYDELSSATPDVSRDLVHRLYQMCSGNKEEPQQETSFEDFWNELEDTEED